MRGWIVPPPKEPTKSSEAFGKEREEKVNWLIRQGYLRSERIKEALLRVPKIWGQIFILDIIVNIL
jgi:hypothetical protein